MRTLLSCSGFIVITNSRFATMRLLLLLCTLLATSAHAGTRAVYEQRAHPAKLVFEIADNGDFRAGSPDGRQYRLVLAGEAYQVAEVDGQLRAARLADIEAALRTTSNGVGSGLMRALTAVVAAMPQRMVRAGPADVNGWRGELYVIEGAEWEFDRYGAWRDPDGEPYYILSREPALRQLGPALVAFTTGELEFGRHLLAGNASQVLLDTLNRLAAQGTLVESSEAGLQLLQAEPGTVAPARLALPGPPMPLAALVALMREGRSPFRAIAEP